MFKLYKEYRASLSDEERHKWPLRVMGPETWAVLVLILLAVWGLY